MRFQPSAYVGAPAMNSGFSPGQWGDVSMAARHDGIAVGRYRYGAHVNGHEGAHGLEDAAGLINCIPMPLFVTSASARLLVANGPSRTLLQQSDVLYLEAGYVQTVASVVGDELPKMVRTVAKGEQNVSLVTLRRCEHMLPLLMRLYRVRANDLPVKLAEGIDPDAPLCLAVVLNQDSQNDVSFAEVFQLSPAELVILRALASGETPKSIASARATSLATVRTQIHNLMRKTGVSSMSHLIALYFQVR